MPGYDGASSDNEHADQDPDGRITIKGKICFTYDLQHAATEKDRADYLATMARRGYKIGLRIKSGQRIERLAFAGPKGEVILAHSDTVSRELQEALPCHDEQWVGLVPPRGAERTYTFEHVSGRLTVCYSFTLVVIPVTCPPQLVPMVLSY